VSISYSSPDRDAVWAEDSGGPKEPHIRSESSPDLPLQGAILGKRTAHSKVKGPSVIFTKGLNQSTVPFGFGLRWTKEPRIR